MYEDRGKVFRIEKDCRYVLRAIRDEMVGAHFGPYVTWNNSSIVVSTEAIREPLEIVEESKTNLWPHRKPTQQDFDEISDQLRRDVDHQILSWSEVHEQIPGNPRLYHGGDLGRLASDHDSHHAEQTR